MSGIQTLKLGSKWHGVPGVFMCKASPSSLTGGPWEEGTGTKERWKRLGVHGCAWGCMGVRGGGVFHTLQHRALPLGTWVVAQTQPIFAV